jgi:hypothetical protein
VTEVRPRVEPNLIDVDDSEAAILLARIDFVIDGPASNPTLVHVEKPPDDTGRPFLLHTQLIQELTRLGTPGGAAARPPFEFATLHVAAVKRLIAWVHYPLVLADIDPTALGVRIEGQSVAVAGVTRLPDLDNLFEIQLGDAARVVPGDRVEVRFRLDQLSLTAGGSLLADLEGRDADYVGRDQDTLSVYTVADELPPNREFVTFSTALADQVGQVLFLWFHTPSDLRLPNRVDATRHQDGARLRFRTAPLAPDGSPSATRFASLWQLTLASDHTLNAGDRLAFTFDTDGINAGSATTTLTTLLHEEPTDYLGYDGDHTLDAFYEVEALPVQQTPGVSVAEVLDILFRLPTLSFVTFTILGSPLTGQPNVQIELWFHPAFEPTDEKTEVVEPTFSVLAEHKDGTLRQLPIAQLTQTQRNVFSVQIPGAAWKEFGSSPYLRFVFPLGDNKIVNSPLGDLPLGDYIRKHEPPIKFEGHNGEDAIIAYARLTPRLVQG